MCARPFQRIVCATMSLLVCVLSYRSTTAILSIAGHARNPTEDRIPAGSERMEVRENKPRPAKQLLVTQALRLKDDTSAPSPDPLVAPQAKDRGLVPNGIAEGSAGTSVQQSRPKYLQMHLAAASGSPHSPPG